MSSPVHLDSHQYLAQLVWLIRTGDNEEACQKLKSMKATSSLPPWVGDDLDWGEDCELSEETLASLSARENQVANLTACLISMRCEGVSVNPLPVARCSDLWTDAQLDDRSDNSEARRSFGPDTIEVLRQYIHELYECGSYMDALYRARFYVDCVCEVVAEAASDQAARLDALWVILHSSCMLVRPGQPITNLDLATLPQYVFQLYEALDAQLYNGSRNTAAKPTIAGLDIRAASRFKQLALVHQVIWLLLHYAIPIVHIDGGKVPPSWIELINWLFSDKIQQLILSQQAQHLLTHCALVLILDNKRSDHIKSLGASIQLASYKHSDSITRFFTSIFVDFDLETAQQELANFKCEDNFYFAHLASVANNQARMLVFDHYCRIHRSIDLNMIAQKLRMDVAAAEKWIVALIGDAKLDAKIDSERNIVEMNNSAVTGEAGVVNVIESMIGRTQQLLASLDRTSAIRQS